jgi:hypothetical protein
MISCATASIDRGLRVPTPHRSSYRDLSRYTYGVPGAADARGKSAAGKGVAGKGVADQAAAVVIPKLAAQSGMDCID